MPSGDDDRDAPSRHKFVGFRTNADDTLRVSEVDAGAAARDRDPYFDDGWDGDNDEAVDSFLSAHDDVEPSSEAARDAPRHLSAVAAPLAVATVALALLAGAGDVQPPQQVIWACSPSGRDSSCGGLAPHVSHTNASGRKR